MQERTIQKSIYISEDGLEFESKEDCINHEQANVFTKEMKKIPKVKNLPFVNGMLIDGYWCETQAHLDCCISWWIEAQKSIGRTCTTKHIFLKPDYYFILLDMTSSDIIQNKYVYKFLPYSYLQQQWDNFTKLIPSDPYAYNVMQEIREKYNNFKPKKQTQEDSSITKNKKNPNKSSQADLLSKLNKKTKRKK